MSKQDLAYWQQQAQSLTIEGRAFINGKYVDAHNNDTFDCISPIDGRTLASIALCKEKEATQAVDCARTVFEQGTWSKAAPVKRKAVMLKFADLIEQHGNELALLETLDMGKPISDAINVDIPGALRSFRWSAEAIDKIYDEVAPTSDNELGLVTREAVGVVAAIVPWNFPLVMASWKLGPALAAGNSVILKPSEKSPLTAIKIAALAKEAGIPDGVFNVLPGFGHEVGKALALHNDIDTLVFTGSTAIAKQLMIYAGESNMKRVWTEAGGKSPNIVFADAPNLDDAAQSAAGAICFNQGEVCTAGSRLLVEASIKDEFINKVKAAMQNWQPGNPLDPNTNVGAIVDKTQHERVLAYIEKGTEQKATLCCGGNKTQPVDGGFYIEPTMFSEVDNNMAIASDEIFGPVMSVLRFEEESEVIQRANNTRFGLAAGVFTQDISRAHRVINELEAGICWINSWGDSPAEMPVGGYKQSGIGRENGPETLKHYTQVKSIFIRLNNVDSPF